MPASCPGRQALFPTAQLQTAVACGKGLPQILPLVHVGEYEHLLHHTGWDKMPRGSFVRKRGRYAAHHSFASDVNNLLQCCQESQLVLPHVEGQHHVDV